MRAAQRQMQEPQRIENRVRGLPKCLEQRRERRLRGARSLGVTAHAVDDREQNGLLPAATATRS